MKRRSKVLGGGRGMDSEKEGINSVVNTKLGEKKKQHWPNVVKKN
jgi:hypothetical protein